jgi:hypothetical protein
MPIVSLDGLSFSGLAWMFKLLPSKITHTSILHARSFAVYFRDQHMVSWDKKGSYMPFIMDLGLKHVGQQ